MPGTIRIARGADQASLVISAEDHGTIAGYHQPDTLHWPTELDGGDVG
jgi:hypothetical protein